MKKLKQLTKRDKQRICQTLAPTKEEIQKELDKLVMMIAQTQH